MDSLIERLATDAWPADLKKYCTRTAVQICTSYSTFDSTAVLASTTHGTTYHRPRVHPRLDFMRVASAPKIVGYLGPVLSPEYFSRSFGPNRMAISAAAEFLFCRFPKFREIRGFLSNRQSESPLSRCFGSHQEIRRVLPGRVI